MGRLSESSAPRLPAPLRPTRQRKAVMNALHRRSGFTSAQELYEALEADGITIGLTTVYRTLHALDRSGQLDVVRDKSGERLYRPRPADGHRHYLVCRDCGLSREVEAGVVERWAENVAEGMGFTEVEHTVELTGVCDPCRFARSAPDSAERHA
ncbi:transcriptional repressor [Streptomyces sp. CS113]|uniref:Fur family transcriptional regulator n=1 Tax=Streptomyces sp. CS113 TaxID=1982761 RepID=UPI000B411562|nr:Fur family transcriptional regulator [Streptomyces sp. CS113]OWA11867.1 transcriptional repressor [Streptomyces sp. CS113]